VPFVSKLAAERSATIMRLRNLKEQRFVSPVRNRPPQLELPTEPAHALKARSFIVKRSISRSRSGLRPCDRRVEQTFTPKLCRESALGFTNGRWSAACKTIFAVAADEMTENCLLFDKPHRYLGDSRRPACVAGSGGRPAISCASHRRCQISSGDSWGQGSHEATR